jgi:hypothetical protein
MFERQRYVTFRNMVLLFRLINYISDNQEHNKQSQHHDHYFGGANINTAEHKKESIHRICILTGG